jgi:uncharacterized membrane protein (UPF0136 family)
MTNFDVKVIWVYVVILLVGGLIGYFRAKSKVSLMASAVFASTLIVSVLPGIMLPKAALNLANGTLVVLLLVFALRLGKTRKFMPSGLILVATVAVLALLDVVK